MTLSELLNPLHPRTLMIWHTKYMYVFCVSIFSRITLTSAGAFQLQLHSVPTHILTLHTITHLTRHASLPIV